jgi:hypothetical protein
MKADAKYSQKMILGKEVTIDTAALQVMLQCGT